MAKGPKTVLVVDDEAQVLRLVESILKPWRVNILLAPHPSDALEICLREPIHLLISDIRMPGMDGAKLAERVLELHPGASVLLISGAAKETPKIASDERVHFLRKPFFPSSLIQEIHELLPEL